MAKEKENNGVLGKAKEVIGEFSKADRQETLNATVKSKREKELERQRAANVEITRDRGHFREDK